MLKPLRDNPFAALKRTYHEPSRMAIMSALCGAENGLCFAELKEQCRLTDGNLNRHLKALAVAGAVRLRKTTGRNNKPRTMVMITDPGRESFIEYLRALEGVLRRAAESLAPQERLANMPSIWDTLLELE